MNLALLGYGYWGPKLARAAVKAGHSIAWVVDPRWDRIAIASPEHIDAFIGLDPHAAVTDPEVDAVVIATPPKTHCALACAALTAGKHVLVTKPMTTSTADAEAMVDAAKHAGRVLMVDHTWCFHDGVQAMASVSVRRVCSTRTNTDDRSGDALWDLLPHDLSILDAIGFGIDRAAVRANRAGSLLSVQVDVDGKHADIVVGNGAKVRTRHFHAVGERRVYMLGEPAVEPLVREFQLFADVCAGRAACRTPGEQGLRVVRVIESLARAARTEAAE